MLFYFSGTGNTLALAKKIADTHDLKLCSIAHEMDKGQDPLIYEMQDDALLGFAFPVHAWGPPPFVLDFIRRLRISGGKPYVFALSVCAGEGGHSVRILQKELAGQNIHLDSAFTFIMPNNFMLGTSVDDAKTAKRRISQSDLKLDEISPVLSARKRGVFDLQAGTVPRLKSYVIHPLFKRFALKTSKFYATDRCNSCYICEQVCPVHSVKVNGKPAWQKECTMCLACINSCPVQAIEYGKLTAGKDRYLHPDLQEQLWSDLEL